MAERKPRILIVEDESKIASVLLDYLAQSGYDTHHLTPALHINLSNSL